MSEGNSTDGVFYGRASTRKHEDSISQQLQWADRTTRQERVQVVREFVDEGIPGDEIALPAGLQAMLVYCEGRHRAGMPVGGVVTHDAGRLFRAGSVRTAGILRRLLEAGVSRLLTNEGWLDLGSDVGRLMHRGPHA
jgi:hypothetical protein